MKFNMDRINELIEEAANDTPPATGNPFVDDLYDQAVRMVGDTNQYYCMFYLLAVEYKPRLVVELGSWRAFGAAHFAAGGAERVITIDIHREDKDAMKASQLAAATLPNLEYINGWTWDDHVIAQVKQAAPIDILYIDAWHWYEHVIREWRLYEPLLADEALVICDDVMDNPGSTVDMLKFWAEITDGHENFLTTALHSWVMQGFMRYTR